MESTYSRSRNALTGVNAPVFQVVNVARLPEGLGLRPPRLPGEGAGERHGVELGGAALERPLAQAHLLAVPPRGNVGELAVVVALYEEIQSIHARQQIIDTLEVVYKVYICSKGNLSYKHTCPTNDSIFSLNGLNQTIAYLSCK